MHELEEAAASVRSQLRRTVHLQGGSSSGVSDATQSDTAYVEDAYAELEQLRCQRDMLREILSQHEELRALQVCSPFPCAHFLFPLHAL